LINLNYFNPWWRTGRVDEKLIGRKRQIFEEVLKYIDLRQILMFTGLRRVGKTTLMFQIIDWLIKEKNVDPTKILYYSFDETVNSVEEIISTYEKEVLKENISQQKKIYLFFDEIQKLEDWSSKIKVFYDIYTNIKIFISGSASLNLVKNTRESLVGRFFDFLIDTLDFEEYLEFKDIKIDKEKEKIFEVDLIKNFEDFLKSGGFIEALELRDIKLARYFKEGIIEQLIFKDLPSVFSINHPDLLYRIIKIIASRPGIYLDYKNIGQDLKYDQRTISDYISYLVYSMLVRKVFNYSSNYLITEKKMKRAYLTNSAFNYAITEVSDFSLIVEQYFINFFKAKYFYRNPQKEEVDTILENTGNGIPVEVKIKNVISKEDLIPIFRFLKKFNLQKGYIITKNTEHVYRNGDYIIEAIPYWRYWTIKNRVGLML
jgi:hypothetical protein